MILLITHIIQSYSINNANKEYLSNVTIYNLNEYYTHVLYVYKNIHVHFWITNWNPPCMDYLF